MSHFPFPRLPYGWYLASPSADVAAGEIRTFHYFGQELVIYRSTAGVPFAVEAHCPHLGAHLGEGGCVEGDTIRCPFHGWRYASDGRCVEVPKDQRDEWMDKAEPSPDVLGDPDAR